MATRFFKNLFGSSDKSKSAKKNEEADKEVKNDGPLPYDTRRKLTISRSGRMKQNLKKRGSLGNDLFGEDIKKTDKNTPIEYHVHGKNFVSNNQSTADNNNGIRKSTHNLNTDHDIQETKLKSSQSQDQIDDQCKLEVSYLKESRKTSITTEEAQHEIEDAFKAVENTV